MTVEERIRAKLPGADTGIEIRKSVCAICDPQQCGLSLYIKDGVIVKVEGNEHHPCSKGMLCAKGAATRQYVYSPKRIQTPLRRVGRRGEGRFEPIGWDEALRTIAHKLLETKAGYGPESVMFTTGYTKYYRPFLKRLALLFGSPNYFTESAACVEAMIMAQKLVFGTRTYPDTANTDCLLVWSSNPWHTGVITAQTIRRGLERGMKMIVVDPRLTPTAAQADIHLRLRPGSDGALALAMARVIITEGLTDEEFVRSYTHGFQQLRDYAMQFTPQRVQEITGVPAEQIVAAARLYATAPSAAILPSASPVVHHTNGVQNYRAVFALAGLTGNYNQKGGQKLSIPGFMAPGVMRTGIEEFSQPVPWSALPPRVGVQRFPVWGDLAEDDAQGIDIPRQIRTGKPYPLKAMLAFGFNHRMYPDSEGFQRAISQLDFIAGVDLFENDTLTYADIVLPACTSVERSELRFYGSGQVILTTPAIAPLYESRPDIDIMIELAQRLELGDPLFDAGFDACIDAMLHPSGITAGQLRDYPDTMQIPPELTVTVPCESFREQGFRTPSGKLEFVSTLLERYADLPGHDPLPVYAEPVHSPGGDGESRDHGELILNTGSRPPMLVHSRMYHVPWTKAMMPLGNTCDLNPADGARLGIRSGDRVRVSTPAGSVETRAQLTEQVLPGVAHMFHGDRGADVNTLFDADYVDPISGFPGYKSALCRVERIHQ